MITNTSDATFKTDVLSSPIPVLLDFWAPWCGPCRMIAPVLEELAPVYAGKIAIVKLNTDENPKTAEQYGIRSIPTLMLFRDGEMISHRVGALSKASIEEWIAQSAP